MPSALSSANFSWGKQLPQKIINLFFPPACANCNTPGAFLCVACRQELVWVQNPVCPICGRPVAGAANLCLECRGEHRPALSIRAACLHAGSLPQVIHRFKYENQFGLAGLLADILHEAWPLWQVPVEIVIPVSLHPERERKRGYNQATLLAQHLAQQQGWALAPAGLQRIRHTRPQVGLTAPERRDNVKDAFLADAQVVSGKKVLLIDDVCTSGATLSAAATALYAAGAEIVTGYCLTRAMGPQHA